MRWGCLTLVEEWNAPVHAEGPDGKLYVADSQGPRMWRLRCDCGYEWEIERDAFPGRRQMRRCNRPECPHGKPAIKTPLPPKPPRLPGMAFTVYVTAELGKAVEHFAIRNGITYPEALRRLAKIGLAHQDG
jgi:hypothetical protein